MTESQSQFCIKFINNRKYRLIVHWYLGNIENFQSCSHLHLPILIYCEKKIHKKKTIDNRLTSLYPNKPQLMPTPANVRIQGINIYEWKQPGCKEALSGS